MKAPRVWIIAGLVLVSGSVMASSEKAANPLENPQEKVVAALVQQLSDDQYAVREKASSELWKLGEAALPALRKAADSDDPEQAIRARGLLRKIQLYITPDTDPSIISMVERYAGASVNEKIRLINQMRGKRAWRQILKLYAAETSAEVRENLQRLVAAISLRAARERLIESDAASAKEFLELAPVDSGSLIALAEFHRTHGTLNEELNRAGTLQGRKGALWRMALHRADGDAASARREALAAGEPEIAAAMAAFAGDPLPWLAALPLEKDPSKPSRAYAAVASKLWKGGELRRPDLDPLVAMLGSRDNTQRNAAMIGLCLLGEPGAAEPELEQISPVISFHYYQVQERISDALRVFGLNPDDPDFTGWVAERLQRLADDNIEDQHSVSDVGNELVSMAAFLENRGLTEQAWEAFSGPLSALAEKDPGAYADFLAMLFGSNGGRLRAPGLAKRLGLAWAGEDDKKWEELRLVSIGDNDQTNQWWTWLEEIAPRTSRNERFDAMLALFGVSSDPQNLRSQWIDRIWHAVEQTPADQRLTLIERIEALCVVIPDAANSLKAWDRLPQEKREKLFWGASVMQLAAADRWAEVANQFLEQIHQISGSNQEPRADFHAYAAGALRNAGRADEAAVHEQWAEKLALGDPGMAMSIGNAYAYSRDYKRAADWWKRAAFECDPKSDDWLVALERYSAELLEQRQWETLASISEIIATTYIRADAAENGPLDFLHHRLKIDTAWALSNLSSRRAIALKRLERCHRTLPTDGTLADFFFPALRDVGLIQQHDAWFDQSWKTLEEIIRRYPDSDNTMNTAAWLAGRACRKLDEAEGYLAKALRNSPNQASYLDTMAEIQFAKGKRKQALKWSDQAVNFAPVDTSDHLLLCRQRERFRSDPLPK